MKVGDKVKVTQNTTSCNKRGDIGIITQWINNNDFRVQVEGRSDIGNLHDASSVELVVEQTKPVVGDKVICIKQHSDKYGDVMKVGDEAVINGLQRNDTVYNLKPNRGLINQLVGVDEFFEYYKLAEQPTDIHVNQNNKNMKKDFAIKSKSGALLEAFTNECKAMGWIHNTKFGSDQIKDATTSNIEGRRCIYFSNNFSAYPDQCSFAPSNSSDQSFFLPQDWDAALQYAKEYYDENIRTETIKLTSDYDAVISEKDQTVKVGCQTIPFATILKVADVVKEYTKK